MYQSNSLPIDASIVRQAHYRLAKHDNGIATLIHFYTVTLLKKLYFFDNHCITLTDTDAQGTQSIFFILFLKF